MINTLLSRLTKVKPTKPNEWVACCPAHDDRKPSLAVKLTADGKILIKCWAGCGIDDITASLGIELSDLFPPMHDQYQRQKRDYFDPATVLRSLEREADVITLAAYDVADGVVVSAADAERVERAWERINNATRYCFKK